VQAQQRSIATRQAADRVRDGTLERRTVLAADQLSFRVDGIEQRDGPGPRRLRQRDRVRAAMIDRGADRGHSDPGTQRAARPIPGELGRRANEQLQPQDLLDFVDVVRLDPKPREPARYVAEHLLVEHRDGFTVTGGGGGGEKKVTGVVSQALMVDGGELGVRSELFERQAGDRRPPRLANVERDPQHIIGHRCRSERLTGGLYRGLDWAAMSACVTENEVQALLAGRLTESRIAPLEEHVDACAACQLLLSAGVRTTSRLSRGWEDARTSAHFTAGEVIAGRYEITRFIARGGMGEVYAALDRMLGEEIALKVLMTPVQTSPAALSRLKAEVQLARRVTNPHVSRVFDIGSSTIADGTEVLFLTMQLLRGETLRDRLKREGALPPDEVWRLADDMFAALSAAHEMGIVHSDFKSDNVMLVAGESAGHPRAVVMDFGLARVTTTEGSAHDAAESLIAGTVAYMAPEQRDGGPLTAAADVYALGVVLYEMLTGVLPPFRTAHGTERARQPPAPKRLETLDVPARWKAAIARCLVRDPRARFKNVIELQAALADDGKRAPRRVRFAAAAIVAILLGLGLGGVYWKAPAVTAAAPPPQPPPPPPPPIAPRLAPAEPRAADPSPAAVATTDETPSPVRAPPSRKQPRVVRPRSPASETVPPRTPEADASSQLRAAEEKLVAGDIVEACALGQVAATRAPDDAAPWEFLGRCYMRLPDPRRARGYYREYLARAPAGPKASFIRAIVEREQP